MLFFFNGDGWDRIVNRLNAIQTHFHLELYVQNIKRDTIVEIMPLFFLFRIGFGYGSISFPIKPRLLGTPLEKGNCEVEFEDGTKINTKNLDYKLIKPLIWWE